jgi:hypothetical protein
MKVLAAALVSASLFCASGQGQVASAALAPPQTPPAFITVPAGTKIEMALTRPLRAQTASPGALLDGQTTFPVIVDDRMAIPPGTYIQGILEKLTRPTRKTRRAELDVLFTKIIYADGYIVNLPGSGISQAASSGITPAQTSVAAPPETLIEVTVQVTPANDLLLDNGAPIEVTLAAPLSLNAMQVARAIPLSQAPNPNQFKSATLCRATSGSPGMSGTPDTVIPGNPGTPDTVIPGAPGMPDTIIPGTPATPSTVIPGSPGTPGFAGTSCPMSPIVISSTPIPAASGAAQSPLPPAFH